MKIVGINMGRGKICSYNHFVVFPFKMSFMAQKRCTNKADLKQMEMLHVGCLFWCLLTDLHTRVHSARGSESDSIADTEALVRGCSPRHVTEVWTEELRAFREHFVLVARHGRFWWRLCEETGAQLHFEPLHLVVMQVLLNQVAFSFNPRLHVWWDVWDQPRHKEFHHKHHVLQRNNINYGYFTVSSINTGHYWARSEGLCCLTSMIMMKANLAASMCQNCMVCVYSLWWPGG